MNTTYVSLSVCMYNVFLYNSYAAAFFTFSIFITHDSELLLHDVDPRVLQQPAVDLLHQPVKTINILLFKLLLYILAPLINSLFKCGDCFHHFIHS